MRITRLGVLCTVVAVVAITLATQELLFALTIAENGRAACRIVISGNATAPEKTAAYELREHLRQVTGGDFQVVPEHSVSENTPQIMVGRFVRLEATATGVDWDALGYDGIVIKTVGDTLILSGGKPRGTLYAVYTFLEDVVGCRWWTAAESFFPKKPDLRIGRLDIVYTPKIIYREAFYRDPLENPKFAAKLKLNGNFYRIPRSHGGHYEIIGWCHTFHSLLPPATYAAQHPEWYSAGQICLTNEGARKELTRNVLNWIRANRTAGIVSVSQNDCHGPCECEKCKAVVQEEGSHSGPLIRFVNAVAEEVEKEFPDVLVETLAYQYTRKAPLHVKPRHNVVVRLCSIECSFTHPLDSEANKAFRDDIIAWKAIAPNLYIWDYVTNFSNYIFPHPNMRVLAPNIRFFEKNNAIGVFEQGDSATTVGDFVRLRAYLFGHLLWDPSRDEKQLTTEFLNGYYGAAGPYLQKYIDLWHDRCEVANARIGCYHAETGYMSYKDVMQATELFRQAEKAVAQDPELARRVRRERMPLDHVWLLRYHEFKETAQREKLPFVGPKDGKKACDEFVALAREWKANNYSEGQYFDAYVPALEARFEPPPPTPEEIDKLPKQDCVIIEQDKMDLINSPDWVREVSDPAASDGKAAKMPGSHTQWAVQYHITDDIISACQGQWYCYVVARTEGAQSGAGFHYGVYNGSARVDLVTLGASLEQSRGRRYKTYSAGSFQPAKGLYVWVAPCANGHEVTGIYVDRIVFVRKK